MKTTNRTDAKRTKKFPNRTVLKWLGLLALLAFALWFYKDSMQEIWHGIRSLSACQLICCVLLAAVSIMTEGLIIRFLARALSPSFHWGKGIRIAYLCEFYRLLTLGSGAGVAEVVYLQRDGIPYGRGTGVMLLQYVLKKVGVMCLGVAGFAALLCSESTGTVLRGYRGEMAAGVIITVIIALALAIITLSVTVKNWLLKALDYVTARFPRQQERIQSWRENLILLNETGRELFADKGKFALLLLLELAKLTLIYAIPIYMLQGKTTLVWAEGVFLMAVSYMLAGVIPTPSGIGSLEFVFLLLFNQFAVEADTVPAILVFRFATWLVPFGVGAAVYLYEKIRK